jgi:hypothetical protein
MKKFLKLTCFSSIINIKVGNLEQVFTQRIESLESECQFLRDLVLPQHTQFVSINQVSVVSRHGITKEGQGGHGIVPMDFKEESPPQSGAQGVLYYGSNNN